MSNVEPSRYAAKLLFQFRVDIDGDSGKRRTCEERVIVFTAPLPHEALAKARQRGIEGEFSYINDNGNTVWFEFIGIMDVIRLNIEVEVDEVWLEIRERLLPMERREKLLPSEQSLLDRM